MRVAAMGSFGIPPGETLTETTTPVDGPAGTAVGRVRVPLDQAGLGQAVQQVGHDRAVDAQVLGPWRSRT